MGGRLGRIEPQGPRSHRSLVRVNEAAREASVTPSPRPARSSARAALAVFALVLASAFAVLLAFCRYRGFHHGEWEYYDGGDGGDLLTVLTCIREQLQDLYI